jgi:hypothetical protein
MARVNGSGEWLGWREEEGGTGVILPPAFSPGWCYEPRLKGAGGNYCWMEPLGAPPPHGSYKGGPATVSISGHFTPLRP